MLMSRKPSVDTVDAHSASVQHLQDVTLGREESVWAPVCFLLMGEICTCLQIQTKLSRGVTGGSSMMILVLRSKV